jgi:hypothetical protein
MATSTGQHIDSYFLKRFGYCSSHEELALERVQLGGREG